MEIRVLRYFLTVVREENISKAADVLRVTQPTLSKLILAKPLSPALTATTALRGEETSRFQRQHKNLLNT